jgi:CheY-like chemotaxis protein
MPKRLLLADDSVTIHKVVNLTFASEDIEVEAVPDGSQALERAKASRPDILLADVSMPGLNGYELCESVKRDPDIADTPVVLLVGTFDDFDDDQAARVRCDAHLTKPLETSELIDIVRRLVGRGTSELGEPPVEEGDLVSARTRESFLGANRILDLFDGAPTAAGIAAPVQATTQAAIAHAEDRSLKPAAAVPRDASEKPRAQGVPPVQVIPFPGSRANAPDFGPAWLSEDMLDTIVERVVKRMSQDVVREVAWEVVPEIARATVCEVLKEHAKSTSES